MLFKTFHSFSSLISCLWGFKADMINLNSNPTRNQVDEELSQRRRKTSVFAHMFIIFLASIQLLAGLGKPKVNIMMIATHVLLTGVIISFQDLCPRIWRIVYNIILSLSHFYIGSETEDGVLREWAMVPIFPTFVLWCTGSSLHFFSHTIVECLLVKTRYQSSMIQSIENSSPEALLSWMTANSVKVLFINVTLVFCIQNYLHKAHEKVYEAQKTKVEFESKKTFLLGFSHELRNLLNSLMGNVKLAGLEHVSNGTKIKDFLDDANLCGELLLQLVNNILDTGKAEIGDMEVNPVPTNISEPLEKVWHVCSAILKRKGLNGAMRIRKNLPNTLKIDPYRLIQILLNLVGNAVKFTDSGSVNIAVEWLQDKERIDDKCFEPYPFDEQNEGLFEKDNNSSCFSGDFQTLYLGHKIIDPSLFANYSSSAKKGVVKVTVSDTGCGMSPINLSRLFQKFIQVHSDTARRRLGTGLGLFITKEICSKLQGQIRVYSKENKGSCFIVCIPAEVALTSTVRLISSRDQLNSMVDPSHLRALVIDDDFLSSSILKNFLAKIKINITDIAVNGLEGHHKYINLVRANTSPHIVTMDLEMPIMDGKKAAELIREFERRRNLTPCLLIIVSGNCSESEIAECTDVNGKIRANVFVKKPASIEELSRIIIRHFAAQILC